MLNIVLFGAPGAGKGTQAERLIEHYGLMHISTGEIIRNEIKNKTALGLQAEKEMEGGHLASDELVISIISDYLGRHREANGTIFDGFPRTTPQAEAFDKMLDKVGERVAVMIALDVPENILIERLMNRGKVSGRADDQNIDVIKNRIAVYEAQTAVVKDFYKKQGKYEAVDGTGTVDEIFDRVCKIIDRYVKR